MSVQPPTILLLSLIVAAGLCCTPLMRLAGVLPGIVCLGRIVAALSDFTTANKTDYAIIFVVLPAIVLMLIMAGALLRRQILFWLGWELGLLMAGLWSLLSNLPS